MNYSLKTRTSTLGIALYCLICLHFLHTYLKTTKAGTGPAAGFGPGLDHSGREQCRKICKAKGRRFNALVLAEELTDPEAREDH